MKRYRHIVAMLLAVALLCTPDSVVFATASQAPSSPSASGEALATATPGSPTPAPTINPDYASMLVKYGDVGPIVELIQQRLRDLGYYNYKVTDNYGKVTQDAVIAFQQQANKELGANLTVDGIFGGQTAVLFYSDLAPRTMHNLRIPTPTPSPTPKKPTTPTYGKLIEWTQANKLVAWGGGPKFQCKDFRTGKTYYLKRVGGYNHMDVEPATAADTAILKSLYGGKWSWDRRPTLVRLGGTWYAASINGFPHGKETVSGNNMNGQICLHFLNSKTHGTAIKDSAHQRCIRTAAGQ